MAKKSYFAPVLLTMTTEGDGSISMTKSQNIAGGTGPVVTDVYSYVAAQYSADEYATIITDHGTDWSSLMIELKLDINDEDDWEELANYFWDHCFTSQS